MRGAELHAKLTLVQQLKQLSKQHEQVLQAYERKVEEKLAEAARQGAGSAGKRMGAPLHAEGPEAKRQRQLVERDHRRKHIWDEIVKIVEKIRKNPKSEAFRAPVDPVKLKIPDYLNIIHFPMDIGTVLKKLRSSPRGYTQPLEVAQDMRQIWLNCRTYNGEKHPVTGCANVLSENFEKAWGQANIEHKWQVEVKREEREEQAFAERGPEDGAGDDDLVTQLRSRRNMLGDLIAAKDLQESLPPGALGELAPDRDMTFEEKRKLSAHIASVPGEKLSAVLDIIEECEQDLPSDDAAERELDMDSLNNSTLWKLKAYVDGVLTATTGPPPKKTAANRSSAGGAPTKHAPVPAAAPAAAPAAMQVPTVPPAGAGVPPPAAIMAPPPPGAVGIKPESPAAAAGPAEQQPGSAAAGAPAAAAPGQQQHLPPPPPQQQAEPQQQQQQPDSPQDSGCASADEVVASTAGGAGTRAVTMHTLGDGCTVAQSGTNVRPSHFVKSKPRAPLLPGAAGTDGQKNAGDPTSMDVDVNDDWAALTKGDDAAAAAPAADAAAAAPPAAADAKPEPGSSSGGAAAGAGGAAGSAGEVATAAAAAAGDAAAGVKQEPAAAAAAAGDGAAAAGGGGADMWDEFAEKAKQEEEKLQKQREEEEQRKRAEEEQRRQLEELERQKELELQQQQEEKKQQAAQELAATGGPAGAVAENATVLQEMNKLMDAAEGDNVMMEVDDDDDDDDDEDGGDADAGAGFD